MSRSTPSRSSPGRRPGGRGATPAKSSNSFSLGKDDDNKRVGQALISVAVSERQRDMRLRYDDDSDAVGSSLEAMDQALDDLSDDVKELGRCLKDNAFAASQLQKVQKRINGQIKDMLRREKVKMALKEKSILGLDKKLRKIEKNQAKLLFGHKAYKVLRYVVIAALLWALVSTIILGVPDEESSPSPPPAAAAAAAAATSSDTPAGACEALLVRVLEMGTTDNQTACAALLGPAGGQSV